jgi:MinD superfamily P-loop ATPase
VNEVVVLSGKGGTGKTSVVGAFAALAKQKVLSDCDVDAADLHLLLAPTVKEEHEFWSGAVAVIDRAVCTECGKCAEVCRFDAIHDFVVDPIGCEGCAFCSRICPVNAITMKDNLAGHWYISETRFGPLVHAKLGIAQENSGKLVALVRRKAKEIAVQAGLEITINDGPPGIGCAVISSLSGANLACIVTEPSFSGIHDMERVLSVCRHFNIPSLVCINKCDVNEEGTEQIERYCEEQGIDVVAKIPFDTKVTEAQVQGVPLVEYTDDARLVAPIEAAWEAVLRRFDSAGN